MTEPDMPMMRLARDEREVYRARDWLTEVLDVHGLEADRLEMALVAASELVTNAIVHADSEPVIAVKVQGPQVKVEVHDDSPEEPLVRQSHGDVRIGGNGMRIVSAWADDWGVEQIPGDGKIVWFAMRRW